MSHEDSASDLVYLGIYCNKSLILQSWVLPVFVSSFVHT